MDPRNRILTPRQALLRIRPRNAPPARAGTGVRGWVEWELIDRRGRAVKGGQSPNMWLDQGLDALATLTSSGAPILGSGGIGSAAPMFGVTHLAVGTDSTAPDAAQTALGAEVGRTSTVFGTPTLTRVSNGVYELVKAWELDFNQGNGNLTEWGIATAASGGLLTRALFLDGEGDPTTVTKTSEYKLRFTYTLEVTLAPVTPTPGSMTIDGIGTLNGNFALIANTNAGGNGDFAWFTQYACLLGNATEVNAFLSTSTSWSYTGDLTVITGNQALANEQSVDSYVAGNYSRKRSYTWGVNNGNVTGVRQIAVASKFNAPFYYAGITFLIDQADAFDKTNENILTLNDLFTLTWARG